MIATDVGNCNGLVYGENDDFGPAGIITHIMNVEEIAQAMVEMAQKKEMRLEMGENGYRRVMAKYRVEYMQKTYWEIYREMCIRDRSNSEQQESVESESLSETPVQHQDQTNNLKRVSLFTKLQEKGKLILTEIWVYCTKSSQTVAQMCIRDRVQDF